MLLGHWGTTPGQNFIYVHLNRVIRKYDLGHDLYVADRGTADPAVVGNTYLEGTYSEVYPDITRTRTGCGSCFDSFHFPAEFRAMCRRSARDRFTRAASSAIR